VKKFTYSVVAAMAMSTFAIAGGDITPVEEVVVAPMAEELSGIYAGIAYSYVALDTVLDGTEDGSAISFLIGYNYNEYLAFEGRYLTTVGDDMDVEDSIFVPNGSYERELSNIAIYIKPQYPVTEDFNVYALLGYGQTTARLTDFDGFQWGLGAEYMFTQNIGAFVDYTRLYDGDVENTGTTNYTAIDASADSINFGFVYKF
jgi:opacity protein-like surface antigen